MILWTIAAAVNVDLEINLVSASVNRKAYSLLSRKHISGINWIMQANVDFN